jgi:FMN phosphatase YigB (HAD superfamily)
MAEMAEWASEVRVLCFDVFGTVVDYRPALLAGLARYGSSHDCAADWSVVADEWRALERGAMDRVNATSHWRDLDRLRTECLLDVFARRGLPEPTEDERRELLASWSHGGRGTTYGPRWPGCVSAMSSRHCPTARSRPSSHSRGMPGLRGTACCRWSWRTHSNRRR